jgi:sensor histidine kinase YesM
MSIFGIGMTYFAEYATNDPTHQFVPRDFVIIVSAFILLVEGMIGFENLLERIMPINSNNIKRRGAIQIVASLSFGLVIYFVFLNIARSGQEHVEATRVASLFIAIGMLLVLIVVLATLFGRITEKWLFSVSEIEMLKREKLEISYNILQDQLNPHFLFNNLSVLKSLVLLKHDKKAASFIQNFSEVYRYVLQHKENVTVSVETELEFINKYIALHKERLGNGMEIFFNISDEVLNKELPPMTLQLLVENAIKHNIAESENKLRISIKSEENNLVVENNVQLRDTSYSTKTGLGNLISRYKLLTDEKVEAIENDSHFIVKVPLI